MTAIHILRSQRVTATVKIFEAEDVVELSCRCCHTGKRREWSDVNLVESWWWSVVDLYRNDPRRVETSWREVEK
jgi:hypothetical protein